MNRPLATSALALILAAGPALSDVTPAEVWDTLQDDMEQMGYSVEVGDRDEQGDVLSLSQIVMTMTDENDGRTTMTLPQVTLTDLGDGTVRSVIEGQMTLESRLVPVEGEAPVGFSMEMDMPGNETVTSGSPEGLRHDMRMPTVTLAGRVLDSETEVPVTATLTNLTAVQNVARAQDGSSTHTYEGRADTMEAELTASGPSLSEPGTDDAAEAPADAPATDAPTTDAPTADAPATDAPTTDAPATQAETAPVTPDADAAGTDRFATRLSLTDLAFEGEGSNPGGEVNFSNEPTAALEAGLGGQASFTMGETRLTFDASATRAEGPRNETQGALQAASGSLTFALGRDGMSYEGALSDMSTELTATDMPFPIAYGAAENRFSVTIPVLASEQAQPFAFRYVLDGLTLDDAIWQALDPEATLPRDPASLTIDLDGKTLLSENFLDTTAPSTDPNAPPPMLPRSLNIREIALDAVGASIDLTGALTFGEDPTAPTGSISGTFGGVNTLLDRLVAMGVVPQEQLMGPRMMMAMFARPVEGAEDQLETEIEFREGGAIFANGQQIQ